MIVIAMIVIGMIVTVGMIVLVVAVESAHLNCPSSAGPHRHPRVPVR